MLKKINLLKLNGLRTLTITKLIFVEAHFLFGEFVAKLHFRGSKNDFETNYYLEKTHPRYLKTETSSSIIDA